MTLQIEDEGMWTRICAVVICITGICGLEAQEIAPDPELKYPEYNCQEVDLVISRGDYHEKLQGF